MMETTDTLAFGFQEEKTVAWTAKQNQRRLFRLPSSFRVEVALPRSKSVGARSLKNINAVGLGFHSYEPLDTGQSVEVLVPDIDPKTPTQGSIVWCHGTEGGTFEMGVKFLDPFGPTNDRIFSGVREIETYRQTVRDVRGEFLSPEAAAREWLDKYAPRLGVAGEPNPHGADSPLGIDPSLLDRLRDDPKFRPFLADA